MIVVILEIFLTLSLNLTLATIKMKEDIDINQPGIVVIYQGSKSILEIPHWVIELKRVDVFGNL
jgi:hypothetical protein